MLRETTCPRSATLALAMASIEFCEVSYSRDGAPPVLDGLNLSIPAGECLALLGRSGAGKTTTLKMVNRLLEPSRAAACASPDATCANGTSPGCAVSVGYVIREGGLFPHRTASAESWTLSRARS